MSQQPLENRDETGEVLRRDRLRFALIVGLGTVAVVLILASGVLAVSLVGFDDNDQPSPAPVTEPPTTTELTHHHVNPTDSPSGPMGKYIDRCLRATSQLDRASVRFDDEVSLGVGQQIRFQVTLLPPDHSAPLPSSLAPEQDQIEVACIVDARLVVTGDAVTVSPGEWSSDMYTPPELTTWTWAVSGEEHGSAAAVLLLRPAIRVSTGGSEPAREERLGTLEYNVTFDVRRSISDQASDVSNWLMPVLTAVAGILIAVVTLLTFLNSRRGAWSKTGGAASKGQNHLSN